MSRMPDLVSKAMDAFRKRLEGALQQMRASESAADFTASERKVHDLARELATEMTQLTLQQMSDDKERSRRALARVREAAAPLGIQLRVERKRTTKVRTLGGQVVEVRTPYASAKPRGNGSRDKRGPQGTGVYPILDQLGITGRSTPALRLLVSRAVCEANSVTSARELLAAGGVEIDHKAALRLTYLVTDDALRAREQAMRSLKAGDPGGPFVGRRVVAAVDGGRVFIRRRTAGRPRKGGRKHFKTEWREPKILTLYVLDENGKRDRSVDCVIDGTLGDADAVYSLLRYHLMRLGGHLASELVLIGDGAPWIWTRGESLRKELGLRPEQFHEIVDYFHVVQRVSELSKTRSRWTEEERLAWFHEQKARIKAGDIEGVERAIRSFLRGKPKALETEREYWARNRERLRYAAFRAKSLPIGSGAVESSVRRVVNLRMKGASITWTEEHAEGILHLRAHAKSGRWRELENAVLAHTGWRPSSRVIRCSAA